MKSRRHPESQESGSVILDCHWRILSGTVPESKIGSIVSSSHSRFVSSFFSMNGPKYWRSPVLSARELLSSEYSCAVTACVANVPPPPDGRESSLAKTLAISNLSGPLSSEIRVRLVPNHSPFRLTRDS